MDRSDFADQPSSRSAVRSSVMRPESHFPFSAAPIAFTFASPMQTPITSRSRGNVELDARHAVVCESLDQAALCIEGPTDDLADRAGLVQDLQLLSVDEAILQQRRILAEIGDADIGHVSARREADDVANRRLLEEQLTLVAGRGDDRKRHRIVRRLHRVGEAAR